jgi:hypothetical protein
MPAAVFVLRIRPTTVVPFYVKHAGPHAPPYAQCCVPSFLPALQKNRKFFYLGGYPLFVGKAGCCILSRQGPLGIVTLPETDPP